jgi:DNA-binding MarR family transcriptional regulator
MHKEVRVKAPVRPSVAEIDLGEVSRIRDTMFAQSDVWYGFRLIVLGNFYSGGPSAKVLQLLGLSRDEMSILASLFYWGGLTANIVCALTGRPRNSISRGVIRLARDGLISSTIDEADRRRAILSIEDRGKKLYEEAAAIFRKREDEMFGCLNAGERAALDQILIKLLQNWSTRLNLGTERYVTEY